MGSFVLFCFGNLMAGFSSLNFVDDKIMPQCQKVGHTGWLCKSKRKKESESQMTYEQLKLQPFTKLTYG